MDWDTATMDGVMFCDRYKEVYVVRSVYDLGQAHS